MQRVGKGIFATGVFLSAFLLFQVQPIVGTALLPRFGGSAGVWTTCMLFFQTFLLAGYAYAHVTSGLSCRTQALLQTGLLALSFFALHLEPASFPGEQEDFAPAVRVLGRLIMSVGPAFLLLAANAPLLQRWYAARFGEPPYRLYALSNAGSLLGLVTYPLWIEPAWELETQERVWEGGFLLFAVLCGTIALGLRTTSSTATTLDTHESPTPSAEASRRAGLGITLLWFLLAAAPSAALLAVTTKVSVEIAPFPLLWVIPLALYLVTFILAFDHPRWSHRRAALGLGVASLVFAGFLLRQTNPSLPGLAGSLFGALFFGGLLCHGELARLRPPVGELTRYYLIVSAGGAFGGFLVAIVAPLVFSGYFELPLSLAACLGLGLLSRSRPGVSQAAILLGAVAATVVWLSPESVREFHTAVGRPLWTRYHDLSYLALLLPIVWGLASLGARLASRAAASADEGSSRSAPSWRASLPFVAAGGGTLLFAFWLVDSCRAPGGGDSSPAAGLLTNPIVAWGFLGLLLVIAERRKWRRNAVSCATGAHDFGPPEISPERPPSLVVRDIVPAVSAALIAMAAVQVVTLLWMSSRLGSGLIAWGLGIAVPLALTRSSAPGRLRPRAASFVGAAAFLMAAIPLARLRSDQDGMAFLLALGGLTAAAAILTRSSARDAGSVRGLQWGFVVGLIGSLPLAANWTEVLSGGIPLLAASLALTDWIARAPAIVPRGRAVRAAVALCAVGACCGLAVTPPQSAVVVGAKRNFYGLLSVLDSQGPPALRVLVHGTVVHGTEYQGGPPRSEPTTYYVRESGVGRLLELDRHPMRRVGLVGLGVGTLATYGHPGDLFRFYELDPDVIDCAQHSFHFLGDSPSTIEIVPDDARLSLEREPDQNFDVLVVDAFSGDAVPAHLLTEEAFRIYLRHIRPDGVLAMHISNIHLDLAPVLNGHAESFGLNLSYVAAPRTTTSPRSLWALLSREAIPVHAEESAAAIRHDVVHWTDRHHSILPLIRW